MGIYKATPGASVLGMNIQSTIEALQLYKDVGYKYLAEEGINEIKVDEWYIQQKYCNVLEKLLKTVGATTLLVAGRNIGLSAPLPPELNSPDKVLASFDQVYKMNHKGVPASQGWTYAPAGDRAATMVCNSPYPDEFVRGVCDGFVRRFKTGIVVAKIDATKPRIDIGGASITILVQW